ncbi:MAG: hypothetical protein WKF84_11570 [Pyrinomonadaceae bacterium]
MAATASASTLIVERPLFEGLDDRALLPARVAGSLIDLLVIVFASSPFAAVIELASGDWADLRVTSQCSASSR